MADTITAHFHWVKPEISGSPTTWGVKLNADLDLIDSQLFDTQTTANAAKALADNIVIGEIKMFAGVTPPTNWKLCDGTVYDNTDIPLLAPILNNPSAAFLARRMRGARSAQPFPIGYQAGGTLAYRRDGRRGDAYPRHRRDAVAYASRHRDRSRSLAYDCRHHGGQAAYCWACGLGRH